MKKINKFGFIVHPINLRNLFFIMGWAGKVLNCVDPLFVKEILPNVPPLTIAKVKRIKSEVGSETEGIIVLNPLLPEQFASLGDKTKEKIISCCKYAVNKHADIIGLGGFNSIFSDQGLDLVDKIGVPCTTGNSLTASLVIEGILDVAEKLDLNLAKATLLIIGATGDIGSICSKVLAPKFKCTILSARNQDRLQFFEAGLNKEGKSNILSGQLTPEIINKADIILTATSAVTTILTPNLIRRGAVVCDVSMPPNIARNIISQRKDLFVFEGGYASLPSFDKINNLSFTKYFPHKMIFGCLAELIILSLENMIGPYSIGRGNIDTNKLTEINSVGKKHGFKIEKYFCGEKQYTHKDFEFFRNLRIKR